uniref:Uncharacterized protein n=1 Tax=Acidithiobacillus ferrianus TaxID=2678518 RepID=A0A845UCE4_9PROT|nr:hypothetical protein [Acidithiobacillus ferrianus]
MLETLWKAGLAEYDDEGIAWRWQSIDRAMMKAPWRSRAWDPTQRIGKNDSKRHVLVDGRGVPLSLSVTGANRHDVSSTGGGTSGAAP